jgi:signal transduction histidine kinase
MHHPATGTPLRRRLLVALVGTATLATVLFALPLAIVVQRLDHSEAVTALERDATRIAAFVPADEVARPRPVAQPAGLSAGLTVGVYRAGGRRVAGAGPRDSRVAAAARAGEVLDRERAFSADVSHQLRTPLTGLLLGLESALGRPDADPRAAIGTAVERGRHLQSIIDDLLRLARDGQGPREVLDVPALLDGLRGHWEGPLAAGGRRLSVTCREPLPEVRSAPSVVLQILEVLVDNAATHGRGGISVEAVDLGTALSIEVGDEGAGIAAGDDVFARRTSNGEGHGIGLALARSLAEAEGGRLLLRRPAPPVFALLLPGDPPIS